jgi:hypothetical protein
MLTALLEFLNSIAFKLILAAAIAGGVFWTGASWEKNKITAVEQKATAAAVTKALDDYKKSAAAEVAKSQAISAQVQQQIREDATRQDAIQAAVIQDRDDQLKDAQEKIDALKREGVTKDRIIAACSAADLYRVDHRTLGLLNNAANPAVPASAASAAAGADAEGRALTGVGGSDLTDYTLKVIRQYRKLAARHDALVDWIYDKQEELNGKH